MKRLRTLPAFTEEEKRIAHQLLATRVAFMMGRKFEEGDWADVYCAAKNIPHRGWSNLEIDVMHGSLGVEHKMLCYRSRVNLLEACGKTLMHPAATRSIRVPVESSPDEAMKQVLKQYGDLIKARHSKVRKQAGTNAPPDLRTGWLLWQESLCQFLYFEEEMLVPNPNHYTAEWVSSGGGGRKESKNLWVYERKTGIKRYSITTAAGAKIQPYFDVPPPTDPNLYLFTVIGETIDIGVVRVWLTEATARELKRMLGTVDTESLSQVILRCAESPPELLPTENIRMEVAEAFTLTEPAYAALKISFPGVNDDHCFRLLMQFLQNRE